MVLVAPFLALATLTSSHWLDIKVVVFRHHPGLIATKEQMAARERDEKTILTALKNADIGYTYAGGLGSGYELSLRVSDLWRWQKMVAELHKSHSLGYYTEWQQDRTGYGLLQLPWEPKPIVSLILSKVTAERSGDDTLFRCEVSLDNATGKELSVRSNFFSAFDGLEVVVTTTDGKTLAQQTYIFHQSPFAPPGREFVLKKGSTAKTLAFPVQAFPGDVKVVKVRVVGTLPGSSYQRILSTETIEVKIKE